MSYLDVIETPKLPKRYNPYGNLAVTIKMPECMQKYCFMKLRHTLFVLRITGKLKVVH